jgi:hypothetical protein
MTLTVAFANFYRAAMPQEWLMWMNVPQNVRAFQTVNEHQPCVVQQFDRCAARKTTRARPLSA